MFILFLRLLLVACDKARRQRTVEGRVYVQRGVGGRRLPWKQKSLQGNVCFVMMHCTAEEGRWAVVLQGAWSSENTGQS